MKKPVSPRSLFLLPLFFLFFQSLPVRSESHGGKEDFAIQPTQARSENRSAQQPAQPCIEPSLKFRSDGGFRIVQFTDIHYKSNHEASAEGLLKLGALLDRMKPDLVFFTGDIVVDSLAPQGWKAALNLAIERRIPWAVVFGNHDDEHGYTRSQIMQYISTLPYCCARSGPSGITGVSNYYLRIRHANDTTTAAVLYGLDSNSYCKTLENETYGYFGFDQVNWYRQTSNSLTRQNKGKPYPALAFFHIPLREYGQFADTLTSTHIGRRTENECYGALNTGMYAAFIESGDVMATFTGHDHNNDYIGCHHRLCLAYGRFSGTTSTYGSLTPGARIIDLTENNRQFSTFLHTTTNETLFPAIFNGSELVGE